ncbi:hypothetical protein DEO72_LG6g1084 [Vigna unguiculata]|uniref:Uncharacterized protein n=1 Tax=Vigna unguiculata TaxID=3917 RepID=A0A4D6M517_VIGUN|nr:hypothetical protein DEO72_LG6g1084 [Vigna unguiculata]
MRLFATLSITITSLYRNYRELSSRRPFRTRALLGFTPNPEPVNSVAFLASCKCSTPQLSNLPLELRVPLLETHPALSPFQVREVRVSGETRARTGNLAQASRIRLGQSDEGSPKSYCVKGRPGERGSLGETSGATLQWSGRNPMAPLMIEQLRVEQRYTPQVQASAESDQVIRIRMSRVES